MRKKPTKSEIKSLIDAEYDIGKICRYFEYSRSGLRSLLKRYELKIKKQNKSWTDQQLIDAYKNSKSIAEVIRKLGLTSRPGNYLTIKKYEKLLNLDSSHMLGKAHGSTNNIRYSFEELFSNNSIPNRTIKYHILKNSILEEKCSNCNISTWQNKKLCMILDHINGNNCDNRLENLRFLCPNCNSLEPTFCRGYKKLIKQKENKKKLICACGNKKTRDAKRCQKCFSKHINKITKIVWPSLEELKINTEKFGFSKTGKLLGVSDNAVRKRIKKQNGILVNTVITSL